jgi:hypothetical protein
MSTADDLERAAARAAARAAPGEQVVAVLAAVPHARGPVYLCALRAGDDETLAWLALDDEGAAVEDEAVVRDAASLVALCETAEEAAAALGAADIAASARRGLSLAGSEQPSLTAALEQVAQAATAIDELTSGVRTARAAYVDELGARSRSLAAGLAALQSAAQELSGHLQGVPGEPGEELARAAWETVGRVLEWGAPERFADAVAGAAGAIDAVASDVVEHLRTDG